MTDIDDAIPQTLEQWRYCIEHHCGIPLTKSFAEQRLRELTDSKNEHTRKFIESYGPQHHQRVLEWFGEVVEG